MGQILHGSTPTPHAIRAAIQRSKAPLKELATQHGLNQQTVAKWRKEEPTRDYFRIEDTEGRRYWLYRQGFYDASKPPPRWFMHGVFA